MQCLGWLKLLYYWFKHRMSRPHTDKHVRQERGGHTVSYTLNDEHYKIFIPRRRRRTVLYITDSVGRDVTDAVKPLLGPNVDCYITPLTPQDLGYDSLQIETATETRVFLAGEAIVL